MLHTLLIYVCVLEEGHEKPRKLVYDGIKRMNVSDVERADTCNTGSNYNDVIKYNDMLAEHKGCFALAPCFGECAVGSY